MGQVYGDGCIPPSVNSFPGDGSYTCDLIDIAVPDKSNVSSQGGMRKTYSAFTGGSATRFVPPVIHGPPRAYGSYGVGAPGPQAPGGIVLDGEAAARASKWASGVGAVVHAFSHQFWGTWMWQVDSLNGTAPSKTLRPAVLNDTNVMSSEDTCPGCGKDPTHATYYGKTATAAACAHACAAAQQLCVGQMWVWYSSTFVQAPWRSMCYFKTDGEWTPRPQQGIVSGHGNLTIAGESELVFGRGGFQVRVWTGWCTCCRDIPIASIPSHPGLSEQPRIEQSWAVVHLESSVRARSSRRVFLRRRGR